MIGTRELSRSRAADVVAGAVGEHHVEQHEVGAALRQLERLRDRSGDLRVEALASEGLRERLGDRPLVLDHEDGAPAGHRSDARCEPRRRRAVAAAAGRRGCAPLSRRRHRRGRSCLRGRRHRRGRSPSGRRRRRCPPGPELSTSPPWSSKRSSSPWRSCRSSSSTRGVTPVQRGSLACSASSQGPEMSTPGPAWWSCRRQRRRSVGRLRARPRHRGLTRRHPQERRRRGGRRRCGRGRLGPGRACRRRRWSSSRSSGWSGLVSVVATGELSPASTAAYTTAANRPTRRTVMVSVTSLRMSPGIGTGRPARRPSPG